MTYVSSDNTLLLLLAAVESFLYRKDPIDSESVETSIDFT